MMAGAALVAALAAIIPTAEAGGGVIEINQALALEGGVTPGDDPGFPVTITERGRYILTGNLDVNASASGIEIFSDDVELDLRGFTVEFTGSGSHDLVTSIDEEESVGYGFIAVRNGTVQSSSNRGIRLGNSSSVVGMTVKLCAYTGVEMAGRGRIEDSIILGNAWAEDLGPSGVRLQSDGSVLNNRIISNDGPGVTTFTDSIIRGNHVAGNDSVGINANGDGCTIVGNSVTRNGGNGIGGCGGAWVEGNRIRLNAGWGLQLSDGSGYRDNVILDNQTGTVSGGTEIDTNLCDGDTTCP
ncbi:right-handed parallel beta-helix repeat-containing protein [Wenzhouxiangella sp. 15181]|uniref:right-handed parallel beta-helix repeat-containing protein n=2 Tax=unclassified Wenzhouxiangella TaxID=2613841 RepID=UPI001C6E6D49|nr:right-handed parallel beta-helix repeat-containing protein [Wenzhouxiangella sp. 15181]